MKSLGGFRILPVLMIVAAVCFGVRFSDMLKQIAAAGSFEAYAATGPASIEPSAGAPPPQDALKGAGDPDAKQPSAESATDPLKTDPKAEAKTDAKEKAADAATGGAADAASPAKPDVSPPSLGTPPRENWRGADDLDDEYSDVKMELFEDLSKRRKDLEAKEKELVMREALLKATQAELEQKTNELNTIKTDIETLLKQQTEQEDQRIASLVKIYEGMKAKDAARIFDSLEMDVLMQVMTKMSERKSAPILAAMNPEKARSVTIMLAEQNKLPAIPTLPLTQ